MFSNMGVEPAARQSVSCAQQRPL